MRDSRVGRRVIGPVVEETGKMFAFRALVGSVVPNGGVRRARVLAPKPFCFFDDLESRLFSLWTLAL